MSENLGGTETGPEHACKEKSFSEHVRDLPVTLYLFGRTGREKEEWFHHFLIAAKDTEMEKQHSGGCVSASHLLSSVASSTEGNNYDADDPSPLASDSCAAHVSKPSATTKVLSVLDYHHYMTHLLAIEETTPLSSPGAGSLETSPTIKGSVRLSQTAWANALIGRIFWDFLQEKHWSNVVSHKIQKKLSKIRLPYFMNELSLTELDMGCSMPQISSTSRPELNQRGLWVELQLVYTGALQMTLQTKFNLSKLGKDEFSLWCPFVHYCRPIFSVLADSDEESSSADSSDEEEQLVADPQGTVGEKGSTKILRFVDKIAKSKYFQKATENEFIKKKFEEMSNTPLLLTVEVQELSGTLVINVPPPPTDRIWYSFSVPPKLDLHVRPKLGEREVTLCHVTEWIEKKLQDEFQKVFVLPNMDDIYLPLMHSGVDCLHAGQHQSSQSPQSPRSRSSSVESMERIPADLNQCLAD
uniref:Testis expressed 2, like n=1 Tax=Takifugu rubripes TaxID=31033 RepID=H2V217_TAKRU